LQFRHLEIINFASAFIKKFEIRESIHVFTRVATTTIKLEFVNEPGTASTFGVVFVAGEHRLYKVSARHSS